MCEKWKLEDIVENTEYNTVTLYVTVPKSFNNIEKKYPEAICGTISIEFPKDHPEPAYASCMISPTRETSEGRSDYDWSDIELDYWAISETIDRYLRNDWPFFKSA